MTWESAAALLDRLDEEAVSLPGLTWRCRDCGAWHTNTPDCDVCALLGRTRKDPQ